MLHEQDKFAIGGASAPPRGSRMRQETAVVTGAPKSIWKWGSRSLVGAGLVLTALLAVGVPAAFANTSNATSGQATAVINADGSETVTMSGTWQWPAGLSCTSRYGTSWVISWWGIGTSSTPANNFTL